jgi:hypothetical protein
VWQKGTTKVTLEADQWERDRAEHLSEVESGRAEPEPWPMFAPTLAKLARAVERLHCRYLFWRISRRLRVPR